MKRTTKLWVGIILLVLLVPLGLLLPEHFEAGPAWGEWNADELRKLVGYAPRGMAPLANVWRAPFPDYAFNGGEEKGILFQGIAYIVSGVFGAAIIVVVTLLLGKFMTKKEHEQNR